MSTPSFVCPICKNTRTRTNQAVGSSRPVRECPSCETVWIEGPTGKKEIIKRPKAFKESASSQRFLDESCQAANRQ